VQLLQSLLPNPNPLKLTGWTLDAIAPKLVLHASSTQICADCPVCHCTSHQIHSRYERTLRDLPCVNFTLTLRLLVRKFFCRNQACPRRLFTERLPEIAVPWARRTVRLTEHLNAIGLALGGAAAARLNQKLNYGYSRNTLLRAITRLPLPQMPSVEILGVDDFAWRKGRYYGTILVDLEQHQPIALLADREAQTLSQWLKTHPEVQVVARDRAAAYRQGATQGAPQAIQVVDRFHLLLNLAEVLTELFQQQHQVLQAAQIPVETSVPPTVAAEPTPLVGVLPPPELEPADIRHAQQVRERRLATYQQVWQLHQQGKTQNAIAQQLGIGVKTVYRYLRNPSFPEWRERRDRGRSRLDPYQGFILKRWNQGCHDAKQLYRDLSSNGCATSYSSVARYCRRLRQAQGLSKRQRRAAPGLAPLPVTQRRPLTPQKAAWLILARSEHRQAEDELLRERNKKFANLI